ncbi:MAG TPA: Rrf2 family transcriptional regulator [Solirubrobacterales bacterium]|nr:Rrf2 family transcriptional regulator [Solirubrobacterales bacterium]
MIGPTVQVTAKVDYAVRAMVELAADGGSVKGEAIATAQGVPFRFLENILLELRHARLVRSQRGSEGGYRLARPAETITIADVIRTVDGPIASIRSERPDELTYSGAAASLQDVWVALRANMRAVLESVTLADVARGELPAEILRLTRQPEVWEPH